MRKGQINILSFARNNHYSDVLIRVLSRENLTLRALEKIKYITWNIRHYDVSEEWIDIYCNIKETYLRELVQKYLKKTGDMSIVGLKQFVSVEAALSAYSLNGTVCQDVLDVYFMIDIHNKPYAKALIDYQHSIRDFDLVLSDGSSFYFCQKFINLVSNLINFLEYIDDPIGFVSSLDPVFEENERTMKQRYMSWFFTLHDANTIPQDIKEMDFHGYSGIINAEGQSRRIDLHDKYVTVSSGTFYKVYINHYGQVSADQCKKIRKLNFDYSTRDFLYGYNTMDGRTHYVPCKLRDLFSIIGIGQSETDRADAESVVDFLCRRYDTYLFKDLWRDYLESGELLLPILVSEAGQYKNKQDMFRNFYKLEMKGNWNNKNSNITYSMMKLLPRMTHTAIARVMQKKKTVYMCHVGRQRRNMLYIIYSAVYNIDCLDDPVLLDALNEEYNSKHIRLDRIAQTVNRHNARHRASFREAKEFVIKENTKFRKLIDNMPEKFELITTPGRLTEESRIQHNCVSGYSSRIDSDECMIYSVVHEHRRHTIEIIVSHDGKYKVRQCRQACNTQPLISLKKELGAVIADINNHMCEQ